MKKEAGLALRAALLGLGMFLVPNLFAGAKMEFGDNQWVSIGGALRTGLFLLEDQAPSGSDMQKDLGLFSTRFYVNAQLMEHTMLEINTEVDTGNDSAARIMDAVLKYEPSDTFKVWSGRFLPPTDRHNLSGPYFSLMLDFPITSNYPAIFAGRDEGIAVWGLMNKGQAKYQVGLFEGTEGEANAKDNPLFAARFVWNLQDPEKGYYNNNTYYGDMNVTALGLTFQTQADNAGANADFTGWSLDLLWEKPMENTAVTTLGAAYYDYDFDNGSPAQGKAFYIEGGYLMPRKEGAKGRWQPLIRYQKFDSDTAGDDVARLDLGVGYILSGHNARFMVEFTSVDTDGNDFNELKFLHQSQF